MRKAIKVLFIINIVVLCICAIVSAAMQRVENQNSANNYYTEVDTEVTRISFSQSSYELNVNESVRVTVYVYPSDASNRYITFSSSDYSIAAISRDGYITAKKVGVCTITAISDDDPSIRDYCYVTVKDSNISYSITYNLDGGILNFPNPSTYNSNQTITLNNPTKTYYEFAGWTGSNGTTPQTNVTISNGSIGNKVYTANWVPINYSITYNLDGGTNSIDNPNSYTIETETITLKNAEKTGCGFVGWYSDNSFTNEVKTISKGSHNDIVLYAKWDKDVSTDGFIFSNCESGYEITGYVGNNSTIVLPRYYKNIKVVSIKNRAFENCINIENVTILDGITEIGDMAFINCSNLSSILISETVITIGFGVFARCSSLKNINIPSNITSIESQTFYGCSSLISITIPSSVKLISDNAFAGCSGITSVTFADASQLTSIGSQAFYGCSSLTNITIPTNVTSIGDYAFDYCSRLTSVNIPIRVTSIGCYAFHSCGSLTSIIIPSGVTVISSYTFSGCTGLTSVTFADASQLTSIQNRAFYGCSNLTSIRIPSSVTDISSYTFRGCIGLTSVIFADASQLTSIGSQAFYGCSSLTNITIPTNVTSIGDYAFTGCTSLTSVIFKNLNGWEVDSVLLLSSDLSNSSIAAIYLTIDYAGYVWTRQ